jgi:hypothetical protein
MVGILNHIKVMLNDNYGVTPVNQTLQYPE